MRLRSADDKFLKHVDQWWNVLLPKVAPHLHSNGGPILMMQASCASVPLCTCLCTQKCCYLSN